jgi:hypothetical protein
MKNTQNYKQKERKKRGGECRKEPVKKKVMKRK